MKRILDTSMVLGLLSLAKEPVEVCASADAGYDEDASRLVVNLDAFLRNTDPRAKEHRFSADWLPKPEVVRESAGPDETVETAGDIFHRWVRKLRETAPALAGH